MSKLFLDYPQKCNQNHYYCFFYFQFKFSDLKDKVVLIENTASLWGTTVRDFTQMNELSEKFGDQLVILAFPTNQFGHQENSSGQEIINALKYVRPGNGFEPQCILFDKVSLSTTYWHFSEIDISETVFCS